MSDRWDVNLVDYHSDLFEQGFAIGKAQYGTDGLEIPPRQPEWSDAEWATFAEAMLMGSCEPPGDPWKSSASERTNQVTKPDDEELDAAGAFLTDTAVDMFLEQGCTHSEAHIRAQELLAQPAEFLLPAFDEIESMNNEE